MTSQHFVCNSCGADVSLEQINQDDMAYVCSNAHCQRTVSVDTPEALRIRILAADAAGDTRMVGALADQLMAADKATNIAICSILELTMWAIDSRRKRTAVIEDIRYEAIAA